MKIWLDDMRDEPSGWARAKTSAEAITMLDVWSNRGVDDKDFEEIAFDHDLGGDDTSRPVMIWLIEHDFWPDRISFLTANPVGRTWLKGMADFYSPETTKVDR